MRKHGPREHQLQATAFGYIQFLVLNQQLSTTAENPTSHLKVGVLSITADLLMDGLIALLLITSENYKYLAIQISSGFFLTRIDQLISALTLSIIHKESPISGTSQGSYFNYDNGHLSSLTC